MGFKIAHSIPLDAEFFFIKIGTGINLTVAVWIHPFEISDVALGNGHVYGNIFYDKSGKSDDNVEFGLGSGEG